MSHIAELKPGWTHRTKSALRALSSEEAKNIVQIIALLVAGVWTYQKFIKTESPALDVHAEANTEIKWIPTGDPKSCGVILTVFVANKGRTTFTVNSVHIQLWDYTISQAANASNIFVDDQEIKKYGQSLFDRTIDDLRLSGPYPPDYVRHTTFDWLRVPRTSAHFYLFEADVSFSHRSFLRMKTAKTLANSWDGPCGSPTESAAISR